jgi:polyhydroxyalkanoate synthesis regulator phasin
MIEETYQIHLFYPCLITILVVLIVTIGIVIIKCKDSSLFNNIFNRHVDEHIDTTDKFSKSHTEIVSGLPVVYHQEFHNLEKEVKNTNSRIVQLANEINEKMDLLVERVTKLENKP